MTMKAANKQQGKKGKAAKSQEKSPKLQKKIPKSPKDEGKITKSPKGKKNQLKKAVKNSQGKKQPKPQQVS